MFLFSFCCVFDGSLILLYFESFLPEGNQPVSIDVRVVCACGWLVIDHVMWYQEMSLQRALTGGVNEA